MNIDATYKRAVRIIGKPGAPHGKMMVIYDILTDEQIMNVSAITFSLTATGVSTVKLTFYARDEEDKIITDEHHHPIIGTTTIISEDHEIDVTAYEV